MKLIYQIATSCYFLSIRLAAPFNRKARQWRQGRKNIFKKLEEAIGADQPVWVHCASLGEFEQGRPLIEKIKTAHPEQKILLTFFSPSGYEIRKNYEGADYVFYLPADRQANAKRFLKIVQPRIAVFIKYEFWYHYLQNLAKEKVPTFLVAANFRADQLFFKYSWFANLLNFYQHIFVQDEASKNLLNKIGVTHQSVSGDTRFDRVGAIAKSVKSIAVVEKFKDSKKVLVAGSTWPADEAQLIPYINNNNEFDLQFVIAPHEIDVPHLAQIQKQLKVKHVLFSEANEENVADAQVLIIDNIGMLSSLYTYGDLTYVGGAFGKSVHNVLEPATFGKPVLYGPNHKKSKEAMELAKKGGGFIVDEENSLKDRIHFLCRDEMILRIASEVSRNYVQSNLGATEKVYELIRPLL